MALAFTNSTHVRFKIDATTSNDNDNLTLHMTVGGGFFTGRYSGPGDEVAAGTRFDPTRNQGQVKHISSSD